MSQLHKLMGFAQEIYRVWVTEKPGQLAAALTYYSIFSLAPIIYIAITVAGIFVRGLSVESVDFERIAEILGPEVAKYLTSVISRLSQKSSTDSILVSVVGFLTLLFAASGLFSHLQFSMNRIWDTSLPGGRQVTRLIRGRLIAFLIVIGLGLALVILIVVNFMLSILETWIQYEISFIALHLIAISSFLTIVFSILYKILPQIRLAWRDVWLGALVTALLATFGGLLVGSYLGSSNVSVAIQVAGGFAVLLVAFYYFSQVFLLGAVITRVYARSHGSLRLEKRLENRKNSGIEDGKS